jgi:hypothetical protein
MRVSQPGIHFCRGLMFVFLFTTLSLMALRAAQEEEFTGFGRRVGFSLSGGYTHTESFGGVSEFTAEFQIRIAPQIYASLAVGYLGDTIGMHGSGMMDGVPMGFEDHLHRYQVVPFTLNLYYTVPMSPKMGAYLTGGGGYYAATYWDINSQSSGDFGAHLGAGLNIRPTRKVNFFVSGIYRFARIDGFTEVSHPGSIDTNTGGFPVAEGLHSHSSEEMYHHDSEYDITGVGSEIPSDFSLSLNGFRLQFGMRFRF